MKNISVKIDIKPTKRTGLGVRFVWGRNENAIKLDGISNGQQNE